MWNRGKNMKKCVKKIEFRENNSRATFVEKMKGKENTNHFGKLKKIERSEIYSKE
jgi:hypothetical protein